MTRQRSFKPGDKVICIEPKSSANSYFDLDPKAVYIVHAYDGRAVELKGKMSDLVGGKHIGYTSWRFELAKSVGDVMRSYLEGNTDIETILRLLEDT